jgi:hypothetical protein
MEIMVSQTTDPYTAAEHLTEFQQKQDRIIAHTMARFTAVSYDYTHLGDEPETRMKAGLDFLTRMLAAAMEFNEPEILAHQIQWGLNRLPHDGVSPTMLTYTIGVYREVVAELLSPTAADAVGRLLDWMLDQLAHQTNHENPDKS